MEKGFSRLTIYFEDPFWVGLYERGGGGHMEVCRLVFGALPKDGEVYELLLRGWRKLQFSPPVDTGQMPSPISPKRRQRQVAAMLNSPAGSTKSQQALQLQREEGKAKRRQTRREENELRQQRKFQLRQRKKKDRHRGR